MTAAGSTPAAASAGTCTHGYHSSHTRANIYININIHTQYTHTYTQRAAQAFAVRLHSLGDAGKLKNSYCVHGNVSRKQPLCRRRGTTTACTAYQPRPPDPYRSRCETTLAASVTSAQSDRCPEGAAHDGVSTTLATPTGTVAPGYTRRMESQCITTTGTIHRRYPDSLYRVSGLTATHYDSSCGESHLVPYLRTRKTITAGKAK